jgi:hypothetical protein
MSDDATIRLLKMYEDNALPTMFLAGLCQTPAENFHDSEKVEIDVRRSEPRIALPIPHISAGARKFESTKYVNKSYEPPVYDMETSLSAYSGLKRRPGQDPFQDVGFLQAIIKESFSNFRELEDLIRRAVELQVSQVLQTGAISLTDDAGAVLFSCDFTPKTSHMHTVSTTWATDGTTGNPLGDLAALAAIVRQDGKKNPNKLIFGTSAMQRFLANTDVKAQLDNRNMERGMIAPVSAGGGATRFGRVWVGDYDFELWTYNETYLDPQSGLHVPYIATDNVIMLSSDSRIDLTFGSLPMFVPPDARAAAFLPPRMSMPGRGFDLTTNAWVTPDGKHLNLSGGTRPLVIPTALNTFARLNVTQ